MTVPKAKGSTSPFPTNSASPNGSRPTDFITWKARVAAGKGAVTVIASYLEIYNENLRDLLSTERTMTDIRCGGRRCCWEHALVLWW